jgi:hypothetical protein
MAARTHLGAVEEISGKEVQCQVSLRLGPQLGGRPGCWCDADVEGDGVGVGVAGVSLEGERDGGQALALGVGTGGPPPLMCRGTR